MSKLRELIGSYYGAAMQGMSYPAYFNYLNTGGKITARSLMDTQALILTFLEEQETKNEQIVQNFIDIKFVLEKLVDKKLDNKVDIKELEEVVGDRPVYEESIEIPVPVDVVYSCPECGKEAKSQAGLLAHQRGAHKSK